MEPPTQPHHKRDRSAAKFVPQWSTTAKQKGARSLRPLFIRRQRTEGVRLGTCAGNSKQTKEWHPAKTYCTS